MENMRNLAETAKRVLLGEGPKEEVELNEASIELPDHDGNDKNFKALMMKLKLDYKTNVKKGDKAVWSDFSKSLVKEEVELDEASIESI